MGEDGPAKWRIEITDDIINMGLDNLTKVASCRRRIFSPEEDRMLAELVTTRACTNWHQVAQLIPGHTPRQCRDRWLNYLSPTNSFAPWTPEEDQLVIDKVNQFGTHWTTIAKYIPGRSDNCIKNRWYSVIRSMCRTDNTGKFYIKPARRRQTKSKPKDPEPAPAPAKPANVDLEKERIDWDFGSTVDDSFLESELLVDWS